MKDKIIEIWDKIGNVITTQTPNMTIYYDHFDAASEIADMVQKFVEWLAYKSHGNFNSKFDLHKYWDGTTNEWRAAFRQFTGMKWEDISIEDMFTYWFDNIKDKEK